MTEFIITCKSELKPDGSYQIERYRELVRCKDCKHATMTADGKMCKYCEIDTDDFGDQREVYHDADWYCADGEKAVKQNE